MRAFAVGETIKITGRDRHPGADGLLLDNVDVSNATIVDIGASDGSTSVDLIDRLAGFKAYVIADLYLYVQARTLGNHTLFYERDGVCFMVVGRRVIGWPRRSRLVAALYGPLIARAERYGRKPQQVLLLNPCARARMESDSRISIAVHDVFEPWAGPHPDVIKVANLLRRDYFDEAMIRTALRALLASLSEGGHLLIVNNPPVKGLPWQAGLFRRTDGCFKPVAHTQHQLDITDVITATSLVAEGRTTVPVGDAARTSSGEAP